MHGIKGLWFTQKENLSHDLLTLKTTYVYMTFFFQTNTIRVIYIKKCPGSSKLYNGSEWPFLF